MIKSCIFITIYNIKLFNIMIIILISNNILQNLIHQLLTQIYINIFIFKTYNNFISKIVNLYLSFIQLIKFSSIDIDINR